MAVKRIVTPNRFIGVTGDTPPTQATNPRVRPGDTYYNKDTGILYITYDGTNWVLKQQQTHLASITGVDAIGEVQDTPTEYTLLRRLKDIETAVTPAVGSSLVWTDVFYAKHNIYEGACTLYQVIFWAVQAATESAKINDNTDFGASNLVLEAWATQYAPMCNMDFVNNPIPFENGLSVSYMKDPWSTHLGMKLCYQPVV